MNGRQIGRVEKWLKGLTSDAVSGVRPFVPGEGAAMGGCYFWAKAPSKTGQESWTSERQDGQEWVPVLR